MDDRFARRSGQAGVNKTGQDSHDSFSHRSSTIREDLHVPRPRTSLPEVKIHEGDELAAAAHAGANWFFWIAILSFVNAVLIMVRVPIHFTLGLALMDIMHQLTLGAMSRGADVELSKICEFGWDLIHIFVTALWGALGRRGHSWAYIVGTFWLVFDALLLFDLQNRSVGALMVALVLHLVAMGFILRGWWFSVKLNRLLRAPGTREERYVPQPRTPLREEVAYEEAELVAARNHGADCFLGIAFLSVVNSMFIVCGAPIYFLLGMGMLEYIHSFAVDAIARGEAGNVTRVMELGWDMVFVGITALWGILGREGYSWAFIVGSAWLVFDLLFVADPTGKMGGSVAAGFVLHVLALAYIFKGWSASRRLDKLRRIPAAR